MGGAHTAVYTAVYTKTTYWRSSNTLRGRSVKGGVDAIGRCHGGEGSGSRSEGQKYSSDKLHCCIFVEDSSEVSDSFLVEICEQIVWKIVWKEEQKRGPLLISTQLVDVE
jgi:hypothetical protein